jgi:F-type H+-transporting ATPase subunit delta
MIKELTHAFPYAKAVFALAVKDRLEEKWWEFLLAGEEIVANLPSRLLIDPTVSQHQLLKLFEELLAKKLFPQATSFLVFLPERKDLALFPQLVWIYQRLWDRHRGIAKVQITSFSPLSTKQKEQFKNALSKKTTNLELSFDEDNSLLGGAIIRFPDYLIDASLKTALHNLEKQLRSKEL